MKKLLLISLFTSVFSLFAWGPGHDDHAKLVMQNLPVEIQNFFTQKGAKGPEKWCHFPDGHSVLGKKKGLQFLPAADIAFLDAAGIGQYQFHEPHGKAAAFYFLTKSFHARNVEAAAFYAGCLLHAVADAAAFNHGPLIHAYTYSLYPHIKSPIQKKYLDLSCMRKEPVLKQMILDKLKDFKPASVSGSFDEVMIQILLSAHEASGLMCQWEHKLALPPPECFKAMAVIADYQVRTGVNNITAAWHFSKQDIKFNFTPADFSRKGKIFQEYKKASAELPVRDPALDGFYDGLFAREVSYPAIGVVCEGSAAMNSADMGFGARFLAACTARSLIKSGREVQMISIRNMRNGAYDPQKLPVLIFCGNIPPYAVKTLVTYQKNGGKLVLTGGNPPHKQLTGFPQTAYVRHSGSEVPADPKYGKANESVWRNMKAVSVDGREFPLQANPNTAAGWNKPVCLYSIQLSDGIKPLWNLNNGKETFCAAASDRNMAWIPAYFLMPFLFSKDTGMDDWSHPELDSFGSSVITAALKSLK